ncbi:Metalloprotease PmbA [Alphaproteobacteria bacterium SO-S41]|nr:Metalloprotease PmbA [Alphaproteobacteria bacterium SO-S41]
MTTAPLERLNDLIAAAKALGADAADAIYVESASLGVSYRMAKLEDVERSESLDVGLRVFIGKRQAVSSTTDLRAPSLKALAERVVGMAKTAPEDPYCGLVERSRLATTFPSLDLEDPVDPGAARLKELAAAAEAAALEVPGVTNSEGASANWGRSAVALATSEGFAGTYGGTTHSVSVSVLAGEGTGMERDYDFQSARHASDLGDPTAIGREAARLALKRLNPRKAQTCAVPIVYDPRISMGLIGHYAGAINGASIARGVSFLKDSMGKQVFAKGINIIDDPHLIRGFRSKPFDGEGVANKKWKLADDGVLTTWVMDSSSAKQLGLQTTGHAARGTGGPPSPSVTNLYMEAGTLTPAELIADIKQGFYVTELIGMGVNGVTGDYSRGASGFWIENGELAYPVNEITIASNLKDMFLNLTPANDLTFRYGSNAPTVRIEGMTIAGA